MSNRIKKNKKNGKKVVIKLPKNCQQVVNKLSKRCQKVVKKSQKVVKVVKTFDPTKQKKSQKVGKKNIGNIGPKAQSKTATMSAPQKNVTFCHSFCLRPTAKLSAEGLESTF
jgi:hypothetical protein